MPLPEIAADARRRRLTALVNAGALDRREAAVYVVEDAHWMMKPASRCWPSSWLSCHRSPR